MRHHLDAALAVNPKNARALRVRASIEIDRNEWDAAQKTLDAVLAINKEDVEAIAMKATIAWLRDDLKALRGREGEGVRDQPGSTPSCIGSSSRSAVREHRYVEAIELEKQAIKLKPDFYEAMAGAGLGYLRLGMEKEGLEWLDKAYKGDQLQRPHRQHAQPVREHDPEGLRVPRDEELQDPLPQRREAGARRATSSRRWSARSPTW